MRRDNTARATQSIRVVWAFLRYLSAHPKGGAATASMQVNASLVDPSLRIPLADAAQMLNEALYLTADPAIGLHAATFFEPDDRDLLESAARSCGTLKSALECTMRYIRLISDEATYTLECSAAEGIFRRHSNAQGVALRVSSDFALLDLVQFLRRSCTIEESQYTVEFTHAEPVYVSEYRRLCSCQLRFGAARNALVFGRDQLDTPMKASCAVLADAFAQRADEALVRLNACASAAYRVRQFVIEHIGSGQLTMDWAARSLGLSPPTLRRHLESEGTTFSEIIEEVRREIAMRELRNKQRSVSEVATSLGFSTTSAFTRAFKRWHAMLPTEYRGRGEIDLS